MIFMPASISRADRSSILISAISRTCALVTEPTLWVKRVLGALLNASGLLQQSCSRRGLEHEGEGTIFVNGDLDRDDLTHLVLRLGIVCLAGSP